MGTCRSFKLHTLGFFSSNINLAVHQRLFLIMAGQMETEKLYENGLKILEELTANAHQVQEQVLGEILMRNAGTEYLRGFLNGQTDKQLFKKNVPIVNYEDVKLYIDRDRKSVV